MLISLIVYFDNWAFFIFGIVLVLNLYILWYI